jgi:hypothetical protein
LRWRFAKRLYTLIILRYCLEIKIDPEEFKAIKKVLEDVVVNEERST